MSIHITEDDDSDGVVKVDHEVGDFDLAKARVNGDLPAALLLGARLLQVINEELREVETPPNSGARPVPSKYANLPTRHRP